MSAHKETTRRIAMMQIRRADDRGAANWGWLDTRHTFSFANYYDPSFMGFRSLRVINEDRVRPGAGFGTHPHRDMEIVTYVLGGALEHADSMGTGSVIRPGEIQRMSAGTGVTHSEWNHSDDEPVHFLQIWLLPAERGLAPSYQQKRFADSERQGTLRLVASPDGADDSLTIHQDARIYATLLAPGERVAHDLAADRYGWIQVARGAVDVAGETLRAGDGAALTGGDSLELEGAPSEGDVAEVLLFDLA
jgi:redox-sensitive bicupin YhaK (pirin superfamily)